MVNKTEDEVRQESGSILGFTTVSDAGTVINVEVEDKFYSGVGQLTTFNQLGKKLNVTEYRGVSDKPDGWYFPVKKNEVAVILETKSSTESLDNEKWVIELSKNVGLAQRIYKYCVGILYNGLDIRVFKNEEEVTSEVSKSLQNVDYYTALFKENTIDKNRIYNLTKKINDCLHTEFGINNLYHRMIFTACALVGCRYGAMLQEGMDFSLMKNSILSTLNKSLIKSRQQNIKLDILVEVYTDIKMNNESNQEAINDFIAWVKEISDCVNSDYWNGEDVMGIFFNEFNRYKKKSEKGQVFTPDHITSLMYRLIHVNQNDNVLDAACGSGAFLVKAMCNMMKEAGGTNTTKAKKIKSGQLFGIEFDREIYALACANMLIHKDGKTNLEQLDTRTAAACTWIQSKKITKVLMNPPFERKYGCMEIVDNVLKSVPVHTEAAFILPDKKLEKDFVDKRIGNKVLKHSRLKKIIKLPEKLFSGVTTSIFIFEAGVPHEGNDIFACYIEDDGLETVKNQGRQDIKDRWAEIENKWVDVIEKQSGDDSIQWLKSNEHLSYQMPEKPFEIYEEDFIKTMMDYEMFKQGIDVKEFNDSLMNQVLYSSLVSEDKECVSIILKGGRD